MFHDLSRVSRPYETILWSHRYIDIDYIDQISRYCNVLSPPRRGRDTRRTAQVLTKWKTGDSIHIHAPTHSYLLPLRFCKSPPGVCASHQDAECGCYSHCSEPECWCVSICPLSETSSPDLTKSALLSPAATLERVRRDTRWLEALGWNCLFLCPLFLHVTLGLCLECCLSKLNLYATFSTDPTVSFIHRETDSLLSSNM